MHALIKRFKFACTLHIFITYIFYYKNEDRKGTNNINALQFAVPRREKSAFKFSSPVHEIVMNLLLGWSLAILYAKSWLIIVSKQHSLNIFYSSFTIIRSVKVAVICLPISCGYAYRLVKLCKPVVTVIHTG